MQLYGVIESLVATKRANKNMGRVIAALLVAIMLALASIFATNIIAGEAIKESKIPDCSDPSTDDARCNPTGLTHVGTVESYAPSIFDLPAAPTNQLSKIENLAMYIDMTAGTKGGVAESTFKIVGAVKSSATQVAFPGLHTEPALATARVHSSHCPACVVRDTGHLLHAQRVRHPARRRAAVGHDLNGQ